MQPQIAGCKPCHPSSIIFGLGCFVLLYHLEVTRDLARPANQHKTLSDFFDPEAALRLCASVVRSSLHPVQVIKVDAQEKLVAIKLTTLPPGVEATPKVAAVKKEEETAPPATEA